MKKFLFIVIALLLIGTVGYLISQEVINGVGIKGGDNNAKEVDLVGSSSNLQNVPKNSVATTTVDQAYDDSPDSIVQVVDTRNAYSVILAVSAKGATATSTLFVQVFGSNNGTDWFNMSTSTEDTVYNATSSIMTTPSGKAKVVNPGTATSTGSEVIKNPGWNYMKFLYWDDRGVASHLNNIQAWLKVIKVSNFQ